MAGEYLDNNWQIRKQNELGSNAGELKITLTRKPLDHDDKDQMTWTKVGELILTPDSPVKVKGFNIKKLLKLKHTETHEGKQSTNERRQ